MGFTICTVNSILCPQTLDLSEEETPGRATEEESLSQDRQTCNRCCMYRTEQQNVATHKTFIRACYCAAAHTAHVLWHDHKHPLMYSNYSLQFGPDILVSSSWICLTSSEMCCSRSLFCSSSWWTRAWASSRAVASALSWSFNRWTCTRKHGGIGTAAQCSVYKHFTMLIRLAVLTYLNDSTNT